MLDTVIALLLVAYGPGALAYRAPIAGRSARAGFPAEERVFWAVVLSVTWSLATVMALAALDLYRFPRLLLANAVVCGILVAVFRRRLGYGGTAARLTPTALVPAGLVILGALLYFPSAEYVIGGKDPGTYVNEGVQIAQRGSLIPRDPVVASVPAASRDLFFPWHKSPNYYGLRFMGFFIRDPGTGEVVGQFPHLFPASIAIGYDLNGLTGARDAVGVWALLGLVAVYLVGARLIGTVAAAAACVLLAVNVIQVWFARYPNSETVMQALVFAALLAFARATEGSRLFFGTVAGALLGFMLFLRYDVVLAMAAFAAAAAVMPTPQRIGAAFGIALIATAMAGLWYLANPMIAYSAYPLGFTRDVGGWALIAVALVAVAGFRWLMRRERLAGLVQTSLPLLLAAVATLLAAYAYFFRVADYPLAPHDAMAFRTFAWYVTPWGLAAAVTGMAALTTVRFWRDPAFFVTLSTFSLFFFYKTRIVPDHFWASRRFLAVILPGAMIVTAGLAHLIATRLLERQGRRPVWTGALLVTLLLPLGAAFWVASAPVRAHVEYGGLITDLERLAGRIGPRDLVVVESRDAGSDLHVLALPLAYIYAKDVLVLNSAVPPKRPIENFVSWASTTYDRVLFLGGGGTDLLSRYLSARPVATDSVHVSEYETRLNEYPQGVRRKDFEIGLYQLTRQDPVPRGPVSFDIGRNDDLALVRFHARERLDGTGTPFRWTGAQSFIFLVGVSPDVRQLTIWMSNGGRPAKAPPATVEVALGEDALGTATVNAEMAPYTFPIPPLLAARAGETDDTVRVRLRVPAWVPAETGSGTDTRPLGVMVTRVEVR
jgi:hypothetical protein